MLGKDVKARLLGRPALRNPQSPEHIYDLLKLVFPPQHKQLLIDLQDISMREGESAKAYIDRAQQLYTRNQVPLPSNHENLLQVYMRGTDPFLKHCQQECNMRLAVAAQGKINASEVVFTWDDLQNMARSFDAETQVMTSMRPRRTGMTQELRKLSGNLTTSSRTRSGKTHVAVTDANAQERGRSSSVVSDRSHRSHRSASAHSASSHHSSGGKSWNGDHQRRQSKSQERS